MNRNCALGIVMAATAAFACALWPAAEAADPPLRLAMARQAGRDEPEFSGVFACLGCHSAGMQTPYQDSLDRFRLDEVLVWHRQDKHSLAYCTLHGPAAQRMGKLLGYDDVTTAKQCLACHAPHAELRSADPQAAPNLKLAEGVTCEDCHGASRGWHRLHVLKDQWRGLTPAQKKAHGMNDLRDPETRARVCLDCHVGNVDEGRFVTHEMYAAGHPPLASVNVVGYAEQMPPHWKPAAAQVEDDPFLATRQALTGSLLAGEFAMRQAAQVHEGAPDFAVFDCDACHHELRSPSWRSSRREGGTPGRPEYREWSLRAAVRASNLLGDDAARVQVREHTDRLRASLQGRPFGGGDQADAQAAPLALAVVWRDEAQRLTGRRLTPVEVERVVVTVLEEALDPARPPDYDTARSLAWLLRAAFIDLGAFDPEAPSTAQVAWQMLDEQLGLSVPPRSDADASGDAITLACPANPVQPIADALPQTLRPRAEYDPGAFQSTLRQFAAAVREGKTAQATARRE